MPFSESSTATQAAGRAPSCPTALEVDVGRGLAARDLLGGDGRGEPVGDAEPVEDEVDDLAVRRGRQAERPAVARRATASRAPGMTGSASR
jgi:hypothetical protein